MIMRDKYINLLYRMTGYSEDVIQEYFSKFTDNQLSEVSLMDISKITINNELYWFNRKIKLQKLIKLLNKPPIM